MKPAVLISAALLLSLTSHAQTSRQDIIAIITDEAEKADVDPTLAIAVATVESSLNADAIGALGEIGLFQLRPEYHDVRPGHSRHNVRVAIRYLKHIEARHADKYEGFTWISYFNRGPYRAPLKHPELYPYYQKVKAEYDRLSIQFTASNN